MRALYARGPFDFRIEEREPRRPAADEVLVRVRACGVCGTDLHLARDGTEYAPLGHEVAAEVVEVGPGDVPYRPGDRVIVEDVAQCGVCPDCKSGRSDLCRNLHTLKGQPGMADLLTVNYRLLDRFEELDWAAASLTEPLAVAWNTVLKADIPLGGNVAVLGPGPIGLMCVRLAKLRGAGAVVLVGPPRESVRSRHRLEVGLAMGADQVAQGPDGEVARRVRGLFPGGADSVLVTSPPRSLPLAVELARFGGTVSFIGIDLGGRSRVELDVNRLVFNKISLVPCFAEPARNFPESIGLLRSGRVDASLLITSTFGFAEAAEVFRRSDSGSEPVVKAVLVPS